MRVLYNHGKNTVPCYSLNAQPMEAVLGWLTHYGYAALSVLLILGIAGLPVPDETLLLFCGYLISTGKWDPVLTFAAGFGGSACGISLSYLIGRTAGNKLVLRYGKYIHVTEERLDRVHRWFQKIGDWLLTVGYFIPGVRHFTAIVAGMSKLEYPRFATFAYTGAALWVATFLTVGYFVGEKWKTALAVVHRYAIACIVIAAALAAIGWWLRKRYGSRGKSAIH